MQTLLTQFCAAPHTAHDGPHAFRFDDQSKHASELPSGRTQMNWPGGHGDGGSVQTLFGRNSARRRTPRTTARTRSGSTNDRSTHPSYRRAARR